MSTSHSLITHIYTADPSAHVFDGKLYIYPSHDIETTIEDNDNGDQYAMNDYHVFSLSTLSSIPPPTKSTSTTTTAATISSKTPAAEVTDHGVVLSQSKIPWVSKQLWAPDCAYSPTTGLYYLYFPARDDDGIFRIGVAVGTSPSGPFTPEPSPIPGSFSIDPACFVDDDAENTAYLYFGGIWGGQLQCWQDGNGDTFVRERYDEMEAKSGFALLPKVAKLSPDMKTFSSSSSVIDLQILAPETGEGILADDHDRRFFEAAWMHKYKGKYYFSYSTGDTHFLVYAVGDSPLGPFTYAGRILEPVLGWTTHHSICEFEGRWWLFHHDSSLSEGKNHLRCVKVREIFYDEEGRITLEPQ